MRLRLGFDANGFDLRPLKERPTPFVTPLECFLGFSLEVSAGTLVVRLKTKAQLEDVARTLEPTLMLNVPTVTKHLHVLADDGVVSANELPPLLKRFAPHVK